MKEQFTIKKINQALFWDANLNKLDFIEDRHYIIHRVLSYGDMDDIRVLIKIYGKNVVKKEFLKPSPGLYYAKILALIQHIFNINKIDKNKYLKKVYGNI